MKFFCKSAIIGGMLCFLTLSANAQKKSYDCSFVEFGLGIRKFSNVPNNVFIQKDSVFLDNLDFGKGQPLAANLGFVFLPDENGIAGKFSVEGYLGNTSGFGIDIGCGYKIGNDKFSFAPMLDIQFSRFFHSVSSYNIDSMAVPASIYDPGSQAYYVGGGVNLHGGSGSSINYNLNYAAFDLKLNAYVSYKISEKFSVFGRFGYNINVWKSKAKFEATGKGYSNSDQLWTAVIAEANDQAGEPPVLISTEIKSNSFMRQNGVNLSKVPLGLSGYQIQFGIGFSTGSGSKKSTSN